MTLHITARILHRNGGAALQEHVTLDYAGRFLRRKRLTTNSGRSFLVDLDQTTSLNDGDAFELPDGHRIGILAADEAVVKVSGDLPRLAWHIGNRHTPCQIAEGHLIIRQDHVLEAMLRGLGAELHITTGPIRPEGGAYGHGRTLGHSHGPNGDHTHAADGPFHVHPHA